MAIKHSLSVRLWNLLEQSLSPRRCPGDTVIWVCWNCHQPGAREGGIERAFSISSLVPFQGRRKTTVHCITPVYSSAYRWQFLMGKGCTGPEFSRWQEKWLQEHKKLLFLYHQITNIAKRKCAILGMKTINEIKASPSVSVIHFLRNIWHAQGKIK